MSATGLEVFGTTLQSTHIWLDEVRERLGWNDRHKAYHALRAVFHVLARHVSAGEIKDVKQVLPADIADLFK